jgi:serine/threonine protein phosphatase PrpC
MSTMTAAVEMAAATHQGLLREHNEDCVAMRPHAGLAVLADGMGGHNAGEVASRIAVEVVTGGIEAAIATDASLSASRAESLIAQHIARANTLVYHAARGHEEYSGMGTTIVAGLWYGSELSVGHIGDSRAYRLRAHELEQLTRDHTLVQTHVERGTLTRDQARKTAARNILTRALGTVSEASADVQTHRAQAGDVYLLCSDGLSDMLDDEEIRRTLDRFGAAMQVAADQLVLQANRHGGADNISVIVVKVLDTEEHDR